MFRHRGMRSALLCATATAAISSLSEPAQAGGFAIREQSAYFLGSAFAGAAAGGPSISSMFWNPATLTQASLGWTAESNWSGIFGRTNISPITATDPIGTNLVPLGGSGDIFKDAAVPAAYLSWRPTERLALGVGMNSPFGLVTRAPDRIWAGELYSRFSSVRTISITPQVAYQLTDWLSVGFGVQGQYMSVSLENAFPGSASPAGGRDSLWLNGDSIDWGITAGVTITPTPWTTIGVGYRSRIDQGRLDGVVIRPAFLTPVPGVGLVTVPAASVTVNPTIPLPDSINVGIRQKVGLQWTLLGTFEWTNWSRLGTIPVNPVVGGVPGVPDALPFNWKDGWFGSVGAEYQWSPALALRAGVGFERSPIRDDVRGTRLPDNDRTWVGAGLTYNWSERLSVELGYAHIFVRNTPITITAGSGNPLFNPGLGSFVGTADSQIDIVSLGIRYRWGGPPAAPAPALITKG